MFGDDLLVAPVLTAGAMAWPVYLPAGEWVDVRTGLPVDGGAVVSVDVSDRSSFPVFARASAWGELATVFAGPVR
ncbi:TIM-barrel domain-containing protein [Microbacterium sp.]|uniref:TIM-barrel domain-containing protein n=1 Tax=Microbacterium sp. TaxID=51671 RepID=UPI00261F0643|nr:TIM-barrel domain-containing protein [Microbacterium sp.]